MLNCRRKLLINGLKNGINGVDTIVIHELSGFINKIDILMQLDVRGTQVASRSTIEWSKKPYFL